MTAVDVLIPTRNRPVALALTLATLSAQSHSELRIVVSDQSDDERLLGEQPELTAVLRLLRSQGREVEVERHMPRRGMAEQRQFLLDRSRARYGLFLDDDVLLDGDLVARLLQVITGHRCGFVGSALIGLSYADDERPAEQAVELWEGPVSPEAIAPGSPAWERHRLHNAANVLHVQRRIAADGTKPYRVAWVGGCVMYDLDALRECGGFGFWRDLPPEHAGEDVLAQLRVMARYGGCGIMPSGAYHQELPTTVPDRRIDAPWVLR